MVWRCVLGGESTADNCQILQTRVNRFKSDKQEVDKTQLEGYSCDVKFTGMFALFSPFSCFIIKFCLFSLSSHFSSGGVGFLIKFELVSCNSSLTVWNPLCFDLLLCGEQCICSIHNLGFSFKHSL